MSDTIHTFTKVLQAFDDWGRPRCQEIGTYVDVDEQFQCAMVEDHEGECDPIPTWPDFDNRR